MSSSQVILNKDENGVAELIINRPEVHNAFDDAVIESLISCLESCEQDAGVRVVILRSRGKNFSAGADLAWMKRMANNTHEENLQDAGQLARLMALLNGLNKPTIALVQGAAYGGAVGLAACCDIVIATKSGKFCLSEVKLGLIPAVISPYVVRAMGERQSRRFFLTAEIFSASQAQEFGLVHELVGEADDLDEACQRFLKQLSKNGPLAMSAAKSLVFAVSHKVINRTVIDDTAERIADIRVSEEGQEGLNAFLQKRKANWIQE